MTRDIIDKLVYLAYLDARKNERNTNALLKFELNLESNLRDLRESLYNKTYKPDSAYCFIILYPSIREIFAPSFKDRIVSHILFNILYPIFDPLFINDSYSCRKGKGTLYGIERLEHHLRSCTNNFKETAYCLNLDISGYFMNINRNILKQLIFSVLDKKRDCIDYDFTTWLVEVILSKNSVENCTKIGDWSIYKLLPKRKSMFYAPKGVGLHIGDVTSLLFSNIYLNELDLFIKRKLKCKHYGRYVDDLRIIDKDKTKLELVSKEIIDYLKNNLELSLNYNKLSIINVEEGLYFLGAVIRKNRRYVSSRTIKAFVRKVKELENIPSYKSFSIINSYLGYLFYFKTNKIKSKTLDNSKLNNIFKFDPEYKKAIYK